MTLFRRLPFFLLFVAVEVGSAGEIAVLSSPEFHHPPSVSRVREVVREIATEFSLRQDAVPNMVVMFVTRAEAKVQRLPTTGNVVADRMSNEDGILYHIWIIDDPTDTAVVHAIADVLGHEAQTHRSAAELAATARRVCKRLKAKISIAEMREEP